jgi:hypothetical protein
VDGRKLEGKPIELVASWIKGEPGSRTTLRVERRDGRAELVAVNREELESTPVQIEKDVAGVTVRIRFFTKDLAERVAVALAEAKTARGVTIDLRGCSGGSMLAAVETADLFLPVGKRIMSLAERGRRCSTMTRKRNRSSNHGSLSLLQDEGTASAAEIFIAALIENLPTQAASAGEKSYGKGCGATGAGAGGWRENQCHDRGAFWSQREILEQRGAASFSESWRGDLPGGSRGRQQSGGETASDGEVGRVKSVAGEITQSKWLGRPLLCRCRQRHFERVDCR